MQQRPPVLVPIHGLSGDGIAEGFDPKGLMRNVRGAPLGSVSRVVGKAKASVFYGVETPAEDAGVPRCAQIRTCGGCTLQDSPLTRQRAEKQRMLATLLHPLGGIDHGVEGAEAEYGYRNKVELSFGVKRYLSTEELTTDAPLAGRFLGMHAPGRFDRIADAPRCELASEPMNAVLAQVRADVLASDWPLWDAREGTGLFRHLLLREGEEGVLAAVYTADPGDDRARLAAWLAERAPHWGAAGVQWWINPRSADVAAGEFAAQLHGLDAVTMRLGAARFRLSAPAFFQVNVPGAGLMVHRIGEALAMDRGEVRDDVLLDLYCGAGALGLALADRVGRVIGVDLNVDAIQDARQNALANQVEATYFAGPCEKVVAGLDLPQAPAVIVDPPRAGLHPDALRFVAGIDARVLVYVACRPSSLLRDGLALREAGWTCTDRWSLDLFPQTGHVEVVARFVRGS